MAGTLTTQQRWQVVAITGVAIALYAGFRVLPTGTNLNHMDFTVQGGNSIEFCDPSNPQFIPVVAVRSPVLMIVDTAAPAKAGEPVQATVRLATTTGKRLAPEDLSLSHTRKLHLLIVDPTLADYQHVHPTPLSQPGDWTFSFTPRGGGNYRVFADFTPVATGRGLYAHADLPVEGAALPNQGPIVAGTDPVLQAEQEGLRYELIPRETPLRAGMPAELTFAASRIDGQPLTLDTVMDAFAHLVAFDEARGGFAHLHPSETDLSKPHAGVRPELTFKITIPRAGRYVIWAQLSVEGRERFVPFWITVI